jgi:hypothetical protein
MATKHFQYKIKPSKECNEFHSILLFEIYSNVKKSLIAFLILVLMKWIGNIFDASINNCFYGILRKNEKLEKPHQRFSEN